MSSQPYYIVSGPHRSGTSLMMRCLEACGAPVRYNPAKDPKLAANAEEGYAPNPHGFFEGGELRPGYAVKRIASGLPWLKLDGECLMVFMDRPERERRASLAKFGFSGWHMAERLKTKAKLDEFLRKASHPVTVTTIRYHDLLSDPAACFEQLLADGWPIADPSAAQRCIDISLYRHRA